MYTPPPQKEAIWQPEVICLFVNKIIQSCEKILMELSGNVGFGPITDDGILVLFWIPEGLRPLIFQRSSAKIKI